MHIRIFSRPKSKTSPAPAAIISLDFTVHWHKLFNLFMSANQTIRKACGQSSSSPGMQTMRTGGRCRGKRKKLEFPVSASHAAQSTSGRMRANEAQSRQPHFLGLRVTPSPYPNAGCTPSSEATSAGHPRQKKWGGLLLLFPIVPCDAVHFPPPQPPGQTLTRSGVANGHASLRLGQRRQNQLKMLTSLQSGMTKYGQIKTNFLSSLRREPLAELRTSRRQRGRRPCLCRLPAAGGTPRSPAPRAGGRQQRGSPKLCCPSCWSCPR